jgi:5'-nucleotidase
MTASFSLKRFAATSLALLGLATAGAATPGCSSDDGAPGVSSACPAGQTCDVRLTLFHTSDIHSRLLPYDLQITQADSDLGLGSLGDVVNIGGVSRMAYVLGRERARADRSLHLDSGDCFQGAPIYNFFQGEPEVRAQSALGVDAAVIGNHEYDSGAINVARQFQKWATFQALAANYKWEDPTFPNYAQLSTVAKPFTVFNREGLKVAVIGMANLSSLTSLFDQPNKQSILPLNTVEVAQFYVDLLRPYVDVIVMVTHLGLEVDQRMVRGTTGIDVVLGGHNHVVINPPQEIRDCHGEGLEAGYIWSVDPTLKIDPDKAAPKDDRHPDPVNHPWQFKRACKPRKVIIAHSGAFAKYVGRLDLILSNKPEEVSPTGDAADYDKVNGFEVVSSRYKAIPIDAQVPNDPVVEDMLQPYRRSLDTVADLDILAGYSPEGSKRIAGNGGDSPLGNMIASAMWLRLGVQTDLSLTNSPGIRADLLPGPITAEQAFNIFPFDNSITKMQLSGLELQQLFDYIARRSASRGCSTQVQIAGARVRMNCAGCTRANAKGPCNSDADCTYGGAGSCNVTEHQCQPSACADQIYVGHRTQKCTLDSECVPAGETATPGVCDPNVGLCQSLVTETGRYELATSNYLAGGGSGYRVLQRNTTQFDTKIQQRDALLDYIRQGKPCGYDPALAATGGLKACSATSECSEGFVCACPKNATFVNNACTTDGKCSTGSGRCVLSACRDGVAQFHEKACKDTKNSALCEAQIDSCTVAGEECKILACVDRSIGNFSDGRQEMVGR